MTRPRACGRTMTSWVPMSFRKFHRRDAEVAENTEKKTLRSLRLCGFILVFFCMTAAVAPVFAQTQKSSLADLIQAGNRTTALDRIRTGTDVNEAQPDGTRPIHWAVYKVDYELIEALI